MPNESLPPSLAEDDHGIKEYRSQMSLLHTELLSSMVSLGHTSSLSISVLPTDELAIIVANLLDYSQSIEWADDSGKMEMSLNRLAQILQIGLTSNVMSLTTGEVFGWLLLAISLSVDDLYSVVSIVPENKLLNIVFNHHKQSQEHL